MISWLQGIVLGAVQGFTEFFPVSSSGHLILVPVLFGWTDQGLAFDTVLHLGTLAALLWYFRAEWSGALVCAPKRSEEGAAARAFLGKVLVAALPVLVVAFFVNDYVEAFARRSGLVAFDLAFWGLMLLGADRFAARRPASTLSPTFEHLTWKQALMVGIAQPLSLLPGTSRSGITMTAGLLSGLPRPLAAKFSFFVSIPVTAAAGAHGVLELLTADGVAFPVVPLILGFFSAMLAGSFAISFLISYVSTQRFDVFVWYRLALASAVFVLV